MLYVVYFFHFNFVFAEMVPLCKLIISSGLLMFSLSLVNSMEVIPGCNYKELVTPDEYAAYQECLSMKSKQDKGDSENNIKENDMALKEITQQA